ncbi:MAG: hypothetical protein IT515_10645 [Burkholderiales bacterium]|nr:hypothetical protein [Burkholderiales bacterium]
MFSDLEHRAFLLGRRMSGAAFSLDDNPYTQLQPRLARKWLDGFVYENAFLRHVGRPASEVHGARAEAHEPGRAEAPAYEVTLLDARRVRA